MSESYEIHKYVESILGHKAYLVGGSVRDELMGRECDDFDFTTSMMPDDVQQAIKRAGRKPILIGKKHGTLAFKTIDGLYKIEVTTHRTERYELGCRKPIVELGCSLSEDLARRDFTMNAIARTSSGKIIDPFHGQLHISTGLIHGVGTPKTRFKEDPLRIMRAARFASQLGFMVDEDTKKAAGKVAHHILDISYERIEAELTKILLSPSPSAGLDFLARTRVLNYILPEIAIQVGYNQNSSYHALPLFEHTKKVIEGVPAEKELRYAALLHDIAKPYTQKLNKNSGYYNYPKHDMLGVQMSDGVLSRFKFPAMSAMIVLRLVADHLSDDSPLKEADDAAKS